MYFNISPKIVLKDTNKDDRRIKHIVDQSILACIWAIKQGIAYKYCIQRVKLFMSNGHYVEWSLGRNCNRLLGRNNSLYYHLSFSPREVGREQIGKNAYFSIKIKFNPYKPPSYILAWQSSTSGKFGEFESPAMGEAP